MLSSSLLLLLPADSAVPLLLLQLRKPTLRKPLCLRSQSGSECRSAGPFVAWQQHTNQDIHTQMLMSLLLLPLCSFCTCAAVFCSCASQL
jgi:mevalonate pyrophosphate decarboxylase